MFVGSGDQEGDIVVASTIGNHAHWDILQGLCGNGLKAHIAPVQITYNADDTHIIVHLYDTKLLEFVEDRNEVGTIVNRHGYSDLRGADHVNTGFVFLKHLKHTAQETIRQKHAGRSDVDSNNIILSCYRFDLAVLGDIADSSTRSSRIHRIEQTHRDIGILRWLNASWVQDFSAKICQLSCLYEMQMAHRSGILYKTRIVVVHTINIGPNLNLRSTNSSTKKRSGIVATTTLKVIYFAIHIEAYKALGDINIFVRISRKNSLAMLFDILEVWLLIRIGTHKFQRR